MSLQKNTVGLLSVTVLSVGAALFFGQRSIHYSKQLNILKAKSTVVDSTTQESPVARVDSLLLSGNYESALKLSRELKNSIGEQDRKILALRQKVASDIVKIKNNKVKPTSALLKDTPLTEKEAKINVTSSLDSLRFALQRKQSEIENLKVRLTSKGGNDYLKFETSQGTKLHYVGEVVNGVASGFGIALLESGSRYEGQWKDNKRHGKGTFYWDDGQWYEGEYLNDKREGMGTYHWKSGEKFVGEWKDDKRNGKGVFYNKREKPKASGIWKDDELVEERKK